MEFLRAIRVLSTTFFGREEKPSAPMWWEVSWEVRTKILRKAKLITLFAHSSCLLSDDSAGRISRKSSSTSQDFSSVDIIPPWFSMLIYHLGGWTIDLLVAAVQARSFILLTWLLFRTLLTICPDDEGSMYLWYTCHFLADYTTQDFRRQPSSYCHHEKLRTHKVQCFNEYIVLKIKLRLKVNLAEEKGSEVKLLWIVYR
jgi:hypothetical protein